jgi:hypothetical protein
VRRAVAELQRVIHGFDEDPRMRRLARAWQRGWRDHDESTAEPAPDNAFEPPGH